MGVRSVVVSLVGSKGFSKRREGLERDFVVAFSSFFPLRDNLSRSEPFSKHETRPLRFLPFSRAEDGRPRLDAVRAQHLDGQRLVAIGVAEDAHVEGVDDARHRLDVGGRADEARHARPLVEDAVLHELVVPVEDGHVAHAPLLAATREHPRKVAKVEQVGRGRFAAVPGRRGVRVGRRGGGRGRRGGQAGGRWWWRRRRGGRRRGRRSGRRRRSGVALPLARRRRRCGGGGGSGGGGKRRGRQEEEARRDEGRGGVLDHGARAGEEDAVVQRGERVHVSRLVAHLPLLPVAEAGLPPSVHDDHSLGDQSHDVARAPMAKRQGEEEVRPRAPVDDGEAGAELAGASHR